MIAQIASGPASCVALAQASWLTPITSMSTVACVSPLSAVVAVRQNASCTRRSWRSCSLVKVLGREKSIGVTRRPRGRRDGAWSQPPVALGLEDGADL